MFRGELIHHATVVLKEENIREFIKRIHELGVCELKESNIDLASKHSPELMKSFDEVHSRFDILVNSLEDYKEIPQPESRIKQFLFPIEPKRHKSEDYTTEQIFSDVKSHLEHIEPEINDKLKILKETKEKIYDYEFIISNLQLMPKVVTNVFKSGNNIKVFLGLVSSSSVPNIKKELEDKALLGIKEKNKTQTFIAIITLNESAGEIEKTLHSNGFETLEILYEDKKPQDIIKTLKEKIDELIKIKNVIKTSLKKTQKKFEKEFILLGEEIQIAKQRINALKKFKATESFAAVEAWVPKRDFSKFHKVLKDVTSDYYIEINEKDEAPTLLNNNRLVKPFEMITELYSLPTSKAFDPTPILAITFTIFFGFMLTDFAYGIIILILGLIMIRGIGKFDENMKNISIILILFGISTSAIGIVFGSYFGDFFQKIGFNVLVPIDAMKQVMLTLTIALTLGALHLLIGLIAGFYENIYQGRIIDAFAKQGVWITLMAGLVLFILKLNTIGLIIIFLAVFMQMFFNYLEGGIVTSMLSVFGFSGFVGDLFSYARLMALAIGTAGIALAVNFMVLMVIDLIPWFGIPLAIIIFIVGHAFNIAMNGLGAFIHSTRLHFLEFFTKFYEGGGRKYEPFVVSRNHTFIAQEKG